MREKKTILFLEDEPQWIEHLRGDLGKEFRLVTATSLAEAHEFLSRNSRLDAIVVDVMLAHSEDGTLDDRAHGMHLLDELQGGKRSGVPVIVYSAYLGELRDEISKLGAYAFLNKADVSPRDLAAKIRQAIDDSEREAERKRDQSTVLASIRRTVAEEIEKYAPIRERTIHIPDEGNYELIKPLIGFKRDIERQLTRFPFEANVFLMLKFRSTNRELSDFIVESLDKQGLRGVRADHTDWNITRNVFNPIAVLYCCKYGIALFDEPEEHQAYSPNVAYELGMMHYQNKDCLILKHHSLPQVPFDLIKDLYVEYEKDLSVRSIITDWIKQVVEERSK